MSFAKLVHAAATLEGKATLQECVEFLVRCHQSVDLTEWELVQGHATRVLVAWEQLRNVKADIRGPEWISLGLTPAQALSGLRAWVAETNDPVPTNLRCLPEFNPTFPARLLATYVSRKGVTTELAQALGLALPILQELDRLGMFEHSIGEFTTHWWRAAWLLQDYIHGYLQVLRVRGFVARSVYQPPAKWTGTPVIPNRAQLRDPYFVEDYYSVLMLALRYIEPEF